MDLLLGFLIFFASVVACLIMGLSMIPALCVGLGVSFLLGLRRGFAPRALVEMALGEGRTILVVFRVLAAIGCLTGLWRCCGTIAFFVARGVQLIRPHLFLLIAFLLPALLSYAFGSCFGVAGTAGVVLMTIARSGQADLLFTAGAVMSGAYFGERCSPASSAGVLTAAVCGVDHRAYMDRMIRTVPVPLALTTAFFAASSVLRPIQQVDAGVLAAFEESFSLSWWTALPAALIILLPLLGVPGIWSILASCICAVPVAMAVQGMSLGEVFHTALWGYDATHPALSGLLDGGGVVSMVSVMVIGFLSCAYSGILNRTGMLDGVKARLGELARRWGLFPVQVALGVLMPAVFCNQTVSIIINAQLTQELYRQHGCTPMVQAEDIGSSVLVLAGLVPCAIACSVPVATMGASFLCLPLSVFLWLVPLCRLFTERKNLAAVPPGK